MDTPAPTIQFDHRGDPVRPAGESAPGTICDHCGERVEMVINVALKPGAPRTIVICRDCDDLDLYH